MSIVDFASIVLQMSCCCLWLGLVSDRIHDSCLDLRRVKDYSTFNIWFSLFMVLSPAAANSANVRHILRPIHFIGILILYVARLSFSYAHSLLAIFLLDNDIFLSWVDILIIWTSRKRLLLIACNIGGSLALVMLQVIQLDLPNVSTCDIRAPAGMSFKLVLDYLGLLHAVLLTRIRH